MSFTDEIKKIGENISASYDARIGTLEDISKDTQSTLKDARATVKNFHGERMHMSEELRSSLEHFRKDLQNETSKLMDETRKLMNVIAKQHQEMSETLRGDLNKFHQEMYSETHKMLKGYKDALGKISADFHSAHNAWVSLSRSMSHKRSGEKCKTGDVSENAPRASASPKKHKKTKRSKG